MNLTLCPDCTAASLSQHHGYTAGCNGCMARAIARSPFFRAAKTRGTQADKDAYRAALRGAGVTHDEVMAAASADQLKNGTK